MRKIQFSAAKALALLVIITILGGVGGAIFYDVTEYRLPGGQWQPVSLGGEKATRILGVDTRSQFVYIKTAQSNVYSCNYNGCVLAPAPQVSSPRVVERYNYNPPPPPGEVRDSLAVPYFGLCSGQMNFVILSDGSVWSWSKVGCCEMGCFIVIVYPLGGMVLGLVAGIVILVIWRRRSPAASGSQSTRLRTLATICFFAGAFGVAMLICNSFIFILPFNTPLIRWVFVISAGLIVLGVVLTVVGRRSKAK